jgi:hypothetical protein
MQRPRLTMVLLGIALAGSTLAGAVWLVQQIRTSENDHQLTALIKWGSPPRPTPQLLATVAPYDFVAFSYGAWDTPAMQTFAADARRQNLDVHLGTYYHMFTAPQWCKTAAEQGQTGWLAKWWVAMSPYLASTADGDTAAVWMDNYDWNVTIPEARAAAIGQLRDYVRATGITWAMLDFMSVPLESFQIPGYPIRDPDFDGDGIACKDDADEKQLLKESWYAYVRELRATLGEEFRLIPNGSLALQDPRFSLLTDGCYVEGFPRWFYGSGGDLNYSNALDPAYGPQALPNLTAAGRWHREPGVVMIEDGYATGKYGHVAALFDGTVEVRRSPNDVTYPAAPRDLGWLGAPVGPAERATQSGAWVRQFEDGLVTVTPAGSTISVTAVAHE